MTGAVPERVVLGAAATVLGAVGAGAVGAPNTFYAVYGIEVTSPAVANELRAAGGALLLLGSTVGVGAVVGRAAFPAAVVASTVLLGYAAGRTVSLVIEGRASTGIRVAGITEVVLGTAAAWVAVRTRPRTSAAR